MEISLFSLRCVVVVLSLRNLSVFGGKPSGCQSATELPNECNHSDDAWD